MQCVKQSQRNIDGNCFCIRQLGPQSFFIWFYSWIVFRKAKLEPDICIHMAVGNMVYYLPDGPPTLAVRFIQLGLVKVLYTMFNLAGQIPDITEPLFLLNF